MPELLALRVRGRRVRAQASFRGPPYRAAHGSQLRARFQRWRIQPDRRLDRPLVLHALAAAPPTRKTHPDPGCVLFLGVLRANQISMGGLVEARSKPPASIPILLRSYGQHDRN